MSEVVAVALLLLAAGPPAAAGPAMIVTGRSYEDVWAAAVRAVAAYPVERTGEGVIHVGRFERAPREDEPGFERVAERLTVRVVRSSDLVTRVTVDVQAEARRAGRWVPLLGDDVTVRELLERVRQALAGGG